MGQYSCPSYKWGDKMVTINPPAFLIKPLWILTTVIMVLIIYYLINIGNGYLSEKKRLRFDDKRIIPILASILGIYLVYLLINKYTILSDTFYALIFSAIIAYALNPLINFLEDKKVNRTIGVLIVYLSILGIFFIVAFLIIPKSSLEIKRFINNMPTYFEQVSKVIDSLYTKYYSTLGDLPPMFKGLEQAVLDNIVNIENGLANGFKSFIGGIIHALSKFVSIVLTPILTMYFLVDKKFFKERIQKLIPKKHRKDVMYLAKKIDYSLSRFVRGRLLMSLYVGVVTTIALLIMGVEFAFVIGFITGIADIVPYIGPLLGFIPAVFFAYLSSPIKVLWVSIFFVLIQWAENNILAPKIIGENLGMHPLVILLSIVIGGGVFGVFGMILSVPVVAVFKILFSFFKEKMKKR